MTLYEFIMRQVRTMTLDDCIKYMENVSLERKPRSRKARHILRYLRELKERMERDVKGLANSGGYDGKNEGEAEPSAIERWNRRAEDGRKQNG